MEEEELCLAKLFDVVKYKKKSKPKQKNKNKPDKAVQNPETVELKEPQAENSARATEINEEDNAAGNGDADGNGDAGYNGVRVSLFDYSVDNYFHYIDTIARLCGENEEDVDFDQSEIQRISSSVKFLRKWRDFKYPSRTIRFAYGLGSSEQKDVNTINLPQFSAATVPSYDMQKENQLEHVKSQESRDFVMYVGGPVWALDWCPQMHEKPDSSIKCEFIAVASHPPGSSYHKMGAPLTGRGVIQIWCLLNIREQNEEVFLPTDKSTQKKKPIGRPRKNPIQVPVDDMNCETQNVLPLDIKFPEGSAKFPTPDGKLEHNEKVRSHTAKGEKTTKKGEDKNDKSIQIKKPRGRPRKNPIEVPVDDMNCEMQNVLPLEVKIPEDSVEFLTPDGNLEHNEKVCSLAKKRKKGHKNGCEKRRFTIGKSTQIKKPRGGSRKNPIQVPVDDMNCETQNVLPLDIKFPEDSAEFPTPDGNLEHNEKVCSLTAKGEKTTKRGQVKNDKSIRIKNPRGRARKNPIEVPMDDMNCETQNVLPFEAKFPEDSAEFLTADGNHEHNEELCLLPEKRKRGCEKGRVAIDKSTQINEPRLRPRKNPVKVHVDDINCETQNVLDLDVQFPEDSAKFYTIDGDAETSEEIFYPTEHKRKGPKKSEATREKSGQIKRPKGRSKHKSKEIMAVDTKYENQSVEALAVQPHCSSDLGSLAGSHSIPAEVTLPRVVSCLAHNGKVAWDVKWRPASMSDSLFKHRMGYLAVLLGNGSLEVWDVPLPRVLRAIYIHGEGNDPRFMKLEPVFKCSTLKRGSLQSIPLTVEWSVTPSHDYLLAGCHDGTVALWKFSKNASSKCDDTKPILCFGADTVPIRAVAWAPFDGDPESSNIIVTAGHERLKFWDLRNPFRPLRNLHAAPRIIYSLDWLSKPSCIIMSFEDGTMRTISLSQAANDLPVSGKVYSGKKQPGLHTTIYSSFAIWSVHVSRITGMVAYCGADGTVFRFQLTSKAVEKDNAPRNRAPSFLCGSVTEEESTLVINTPVLHAPFQLKSCERGRRPAESFRELLSRTNNQIAKTSNSDCRALALCNDGLDLESESEEALSSRKQPKRPKLIHSNKEKPVQNQTLICRDDVSISTPRVDNEESNLSNIPEVFPSKMVALHKVRWNMNKGSERWLCSGGAGGIVRCQKTVLYDIDRKWAFKR